MTTTHQPMPPELRREIAVRLAGLGPMTTTHLQLMTPRELNDEIRAIAARLAVLEPWVTTLTTARKRYLLADNAHVVRGIDHGFAREGGFPSDPTLAPLAQGKPPLRRAEQEIAHLRERRDMLRGLLPSDEEVARARDQAERTAAKTATAIAKRAARLEARIDALRAVAVKELARLALEIAEESYCVWTANLKLDSACAEADIERPATPRPEAPRLPQLATLGRFLATHFAVGGRPYAVDPTLARALSE